MPLHGQEVPPPDRPAVDTRHSGLSRLCKPGADREGKRQGAVSFIDDTCLLNLRMHVISAELWNHWEA
jgi:hypothetical protein